MCGHQVSQLKSFFSPQQYAQLTPMQIDYLIDLIDLLKINSVKDESTSSIDAPVGLGNKQALEFMLQLAERDGFIACNVDNIAGHIEWGSGDELIGMIAHLDVVPADDSWLPFEPKIQNGYLYARGVSDDKGPLLAAYYAIKQLKQQGIMANKRIRLIFGTDEESDWQCVKAYFAKQPKPDLGFSPDAQFPIVNSEKGSVSLQVDFAIDNSALIEFYCGEKRNIVPDHAHATIHINPDNLSTMQQQFTDYLAQQGVSGDFIYHADSQQVELNLVGISCHGSQPEQGKNAGTYLAHWLMQYITDSDFLRFIGSELQQNYSGTKFTANHDKLNCADLSLNTGVMRYSKQQSWLQLNFRYPSSITQQQLLTLVEQNCSISASCKVIGQPKPPHFVAEDSQLVQSLKQAYQQITGQSAYCITSGGGTFARLFTNCVGFGALFPDDEDTMHQSNEKSKLANLFITIDIYTQALKNLLTIK